MYDDEPTIRHGVVERGLQDGQYEVRIDGLVHVCQIGPILLRAGVSITEGDRVTIRSESESDYGGEITQVRPPLAPPTRAEAYRPASLIAREASALRPKDQKIDRTVHPGWVTGADCLPRAGDEVYCTAGVGTVLRVLGKTGNGSRLLEIRIPGKPRAPFFAAASNVLIVPADEGSGAPVAALER